VNPSRSLKVSNLLLTEDEYVLCFQRILSMILDILKMLNKLRKNRILMPLKFV
jgi:hypothetical protein